MYSPVPVQSGKIWLLLFVLVSIRFAAFVFTVVKALSVWANVRFLPVVGVSP